MRPVGVSHEVCLVEATISTGTGKHSTTELSLNSKIKFELKDIFFSFLLSLIL